MSADTTGRHQPLVLVDDPAPRVRRLTLNRPEKRNAISNALRTELYDALHAADRDPDVGVSIIRGAGPCFSSGYDLKSSLVEDRPFYTSGGDGTWSRHVSDGLVAAVGPRQAGDRAGARLRDGRWHASSPRPATSCTSPRTRSSATRSCACSARPTSNSTPWIVGMRAAMELMLTGDAVDGREAVRIGMANRAFPEADLERETLAMAERVASIPADILQINKRTVHRAMEFKGVRTATRAGSELQGLASNLESTREFFADPSAAVKKAARNR